MPDDELTLCLSLLSLWKPPSWAMASPISVYNSNALDTHISSVRAFLCVCSLLKYFMLFMRCRLYWQFLHSEKPVRDQGIVSVMTTPMAWLEGVDKEMATKSRVKKKEWFGSLSSSIPHFLEMYLMFKLFKPYACNKVQYHMPK